MHSNTEHTRQENELLASQARIYASYPLTGFPCPDEVNTDPAAILEQEVSRVLIKHLVIGAVKVL